MYRRVHVERVWRVQSSTTKSSETGVVFRSRSAATFRIKRFALARARRTSERREISERMIEGIGLLEKMKQWTKEIGNIQGIFKERSTNQKQHAWVQQRDSVREVKASTPVIIRCTWVIIRWIRDVPGPEELIISKFPVRKVVRKKVRKHSLVLYLKNGSNKTNS